MSTLNVIANNIVNYLSGHGVAVATMGGWGTPEANEPVTILVSENLTVRVLPDRIVVEAVVARPFAGGTDFIYRGMGSFHVLTTTLDAIQETLKA